jgi:DNA-binding NarL/FixJ family response regulator
MGKEIRIIVADDHRMVRKAWELLLLAREEYKVVGHAANGAEVLQLLQELKVDVVLMDLDMPVMNGIEATDKIRNCFPWVKVIALTMQKDSTYIKRFFSAGAHGFITKNASEDELMEAIQDVLEGKRYLSKEVSDVLSNSLLEPAVSRKQNFYGLSEREIEIIKLIAKGSTTNEIADMLHLSVKTVESHRRNIFKKLQVKNVAQLMTKTKERVF